MSRPKSFRESDLLDAALMRFWAFGYHSTSMDDLVTATGVSRHGIYSVFADKRGLFLACLTHYRSKVVDPAFCGVEQKQATIDDIGHYFDRQIGLAEQAGLPGPGCLFANTSTERAPHDRAVLSVVHAHNQRLCQGFSQAIANSRISRTVKLTARDRQLASASVAFANGLWGMSCLTEDASLLRLSAKAFVKLLQTGVGDDAD
jgi:TetR/AcrR family transcriptional regulator, transcriptional repressor for nem operon